ncbi:hypothetical protein SLS58_004865 [Diplodia intermedia]|uniref:DUF7730 domain-containing protein n=1 Tax=Diplodia intermedia TaxID=856260 RepID=A0ABR3TSG9_9PEZI
MDPAKPFIFGHLHFFVYTSTPHSPRQPTAPLKQRFRLLRYSRAQTDLELSPKPDARLPAMANHNRIHTHPKPAPSQPNLTKSIVSDKSKQPAVTNENKKPAIGKEKKTSAVIRTKKKRLGFLDLPGEIRNMIYAYCFEDEIWVDLTPRSAHILKQNKVQPGTWASAALYAAPKPPADENNEDASNAAVTAPAAEIANANALPHLTITGRRTARFSAGNTTVTGNPTVPARHKPQKIAYKPRPRRQHTTDTATDTPPETKWATSPGALVLTCRKIHAEALPFFYALPFFIFSAPRALLRFLALLPPAKLALVRKLHVAHATYGDPADPDDEPWRARHGRAWKRAMDEAARLLTGLRLLRCRVVANERPLVFALASAPWAQVLVDAWGAACRREAPDEGKLRRRGAPDPPLRVEIAVQSAWVVKGAYMPNEALRGALVELHRLFAEAVRRRLCGWSEEDAMVEFNLVKFDKYKWLTVLFPMP